MTFEEYVKKYIFGKTASGQTWSKLEDIQMDSGLDTQTVQTWSAYIRGYWYWFQTNKRKDPTAEDIITKWAQETSIVVVPPPMPPQPDNTYRFYGWKRKWVFHNIADKATVAEMTNAHPYNIRWNPTILATYARLYGQAEADALVAQQKTGKYSMVESVSFDRVVGAWYDYPPPKPVPAPLVAGHDQRVVTVGPFGGSGAPQKVVYDRVTDMTQPELEASLEEIVRRVMPEILREVMPELLQAFMSGVAVPTVAAAQAPAPINLTLLDKACPTCGKAIDWLDTLLGRK